MKKTQIFAFCMLGLCSMSTQANVWQPSLGHTQIRIWPGNPPDTRPIVDPNIETAKLRGPVAGHTWMEIGKISEPTMTIYYPNGKNTGVTIVVFPGGGYRILSIDLEGTEVCEWLTSQGITCVLLKYRVPGNELYQRSDYPKSGPYPESPIALEDAERTLRLLRFQAAQWRIDPQKIGVLGFSAGGHLVAEISTEFEKNLYPAVDVADQESFRPDFAIAIYPGHLSLKAAEQDAQQGTKAYKLTYPEHPSIADKNIALNPNIHVSTQTPPTFLLQAEDDNWADIGNSLAYYIALKNAGIPVEMHLYAQGGHGFGLRQTALPITKWPQLLKTWLQTIGMIPTKLRENAED